MDLYDELGVPRDATQGDIKKAFKRKANKLHPDKNDGATIEEFKNLQLAHNCLKDPHKRKKYDETGSVEKEDTVRAEAIRCLSFLYSQHLAQNDFKPFDFSNLIARDIGKNKDALERDLLGVEAGLKKLSVLVENTKGSEVFLNILNANISNLNLKKNTITKQSLALDLAYEILKESRYDGDIGETPPIFTTSTFTL